MDNKKPCDAANTDEASTTSNDKYSSDDSSNGKQDKLCLFQETLGAILTPSNEHTHVDTKTIQPIIPNEHTGNQCVPIQMPEISNITYQVDNDIIKPAGLQHRAEDTNASQLKSIPYISMIALETKRLRHQSHITKCDSLSAVTPYQILTERREMCGFVPMDVGRGVENLRSESEDTARKREMRLMKNRDAAKECRKRKKEYVKCLETRVAVLEYQNKQLIEELRTLKELYVHKN